MIDFVICEENASYVTIYKKEIEKIMMNFDMEYSYHIFKGYDDNWKEYVANDGTFKVHILALQAKVGSGLDAARFIREELDDWQSMLIMVSTHMDYKNEALDNRLMLIDFICKYDSFNRRFGEAIKIALKNYDKRPKALKFTYKKIAYNIELRKILYIEKEQDTKRCICKTIDGKYLIAGNLKTIETMLDKRFIKVHRSIIVNSEQIKHYNSKENIITFKNKDELSAISRYKKKELERVVRGLEQ